MSFGNGVSTTNLSSAALIDELIGNVTREGLQETTRIPMDALARQLASDTVISAFAGVVGKKTVALLNATTDVNNGTPGHVYDDPDENRNGIYSREGSIWVFQRPFPDTAAFLTVVSGTAANKVAARARVGVSPSRIEIFFIVPNADNTGPVTLSVNGLPTKPLRNVNGEEFLAGEWSAGRMKLFADLGNEYRLLQAPDVEALSDIARTGADQAAQSAGSAKISEDAALASKNIAAGYASDAVSQGNVPIYATIAGMGDLAIPNGINTIHVNGAMSPEDGLGGKFCDFDTGNGVAFVSGGETARPWYRAEDSVGSKPWGRTFRYLRDKSRDLPHAFDFIAASKHFAIENYTSNVDVTDDIRSAALALNGAELSLPKGLLRIDHSLILPRGTVLSGVGRYDRWDNRNSDYPGGTVFKTLGAGNPQRWTDITGDDLADRTPMIVAGGNGVHIANVTLLTSDDTEAWSMGFYYPCVKQCGLHSVNAFGLTDACIYQDLTWSNRNDVLKALHPEIETSTGMNEFILDGQGWVQGGGQKGFALKIKGTERPWDTLPASEWKWGWGGASDNKFLGQQRYGATGILGGCVEYDVQLAGETAYGQGLTMSDPAFRLSEQGRYYFKLSAINRLILNGPYAETTGTTTPEIAVTSKTQKAISGLWSFGDNINGTFTVDGVVVGAGSNLSWHDTRVFSFIKMNGMGRIRTPNLDMPGTHATQIPRMTSFGPSGQMRFAVDDGTQRTDYLRIQQDVVRPEITDTYGLGTATFRYNQVHSVTALVDNIEVASSVLARNTGTVNLGSNGRPFNQAYLASVRLGVTDRRVNIESGPGSPEGVLSAPIGSMYRRTDGAAGTINYDKVSGTGNTGWVAS